MNTEQRINEIIALTGNHDEVLRLMLEALVLQAQLEQLQVNK